MDEMDLPQMKKEVESLKYQLAFKREKSSKPFGKVIEDGVPEDPFLNPELMKTTHGWRRKMHPSLEETTRPVMSYQLQPR
ncbi:hypothetical protein INR49_032532 [Caranx melampygus]|nr:hypothetical protein INR49_032532 [Caranx melampygus]